GRPFASVMVTGMEPWSIGPTVFTVHVANRAPSRSAKGTAGSGGAAAFGPGEAPAPLRSRERACFGLRGAPAPAPSRTTSARDTALAPPRDAKAAVTARAFR